MGRIILAVIVALIVAFAIIMVVDMGNSMIVMPPSQELMKDPAGLCDYMSRSPAKAYIVQLIGYVLASFAAGFIVTKMSRRESPGLMLPIIVGALLTLAAIGNLVTLPCQPVWFAIISVLTFLPISLIGHRFAAGRF
jgi:hypothetical protein